MFKFLVAVALAAGLLFAGTPDAQSAQDKTGVRLGVVVTPKNFPNHRGEDVADMFRQSAELGSFSVMRVNWSDPKHWQAAQAMLTLAERRNLVTVLEFTPFKADEIKGASIDAPKDVIDAAGKRVSFTVPSVAEHFSKSVLELAELKPAYLAVATDANLLQLSDPAEYEAFAEVYRALYPKIKQRSPQTKVYVSFQWEAMQGRDVAGMRKVTAPFRSQLDLLTLNSDPRKLYEKGGPASVPANYYARAPDVDSRSDALFLQLTWPSEGNNGEADQVAFIRDIPRLVASAKPAMLAWTFLHDVKVLVFFTARLGLADPDGKPKPSMAAFRALGNDRPTPVAANAAAAPARMARSSATVASREPAQFAVFTSKKDGSDLKILISNPDQEMSHPRVSPDRSRVVITRYTKRGRDGKATEAQGYEGTEILLMNLDGSNLETIIPAKPSVVSANGGWTPEGRSLIYISTDNAQRVPELRQIDLATREVTKLPTPAGLRATDPHWDAGKIVFPAKADEGKGADSLWVMNPDGSAPRQITWPPRSKGGPGLFGDFDPKMSPDGTKVAFMRIDGGEAWKVMVLDLASGTEKLLTPPGPLEWLPTWSSDGKLLLFVRIDRTKPKEIGLYTMTPDGSDRKMIPLPLGYLYGHSAFFPGDGSGEVARIIFTGTPKPGL
nr:hypothetical protein [Rhodoferax sp.]